MSLKFDKILGKMREKDLSGALRSSGNLPYLYLTDPTYNDMTRPGTIRIGYDTTRNYLVIEELNNSAGWEEVISWQKLYS